MIKLNQKIEVSRKAYAALYNKFTVELAFKYEHDTNKFFVKLMMQKSVVMISLIINQYPL